MQLCVGPTRPVYEGDSVLIAVINPGNPPPLPKSNTQSAVRRKSASQSASGICRDQIRAESLALTKDMRAFLRKKRYEVIRSVDLEGLQRKSLYDLVAYLHRQTRISSSSGALERLAASGLAWRIKMLNATGSCPGCGWLHPALRAVDLSNAGVSHWIVLVSPDSPDPKKA